MVGGDYIDRNSAAALPLEGRIVQIAFQSSAKATVDFRRIMRKRRLTHTGSGLRPRSVADKGKMARAMEEKVWPLLNAGKVPPVIDLDLPAGARPLSRPCPHGNQRTYRQDRANPLEFAAIRLKSSPQLDFLGATHERPAEGDVRR